MKRISLLFLMAVVALTTWAATEITYKVSDAALTQQELQGGGMMVALRIQTTSRDMYISAADNCGFDPSTGSTVWTVVKSGTGICLKNMKTKEYIGGAGTTLTRTKLYSEAKVFTPVKVTSKVAETVAAADENRSYWLTFQNGGSTWYLNTNTSGYQTVKYATGNGCWSTIYLYKVVTEETVTTPIIPVPTKVLAGTGTLSDWTWDGVKETIDETMDAEAYRMEITTSGITVKAGSNKGLFYARQSLKQLEEDSHTLPCITIEDKPRFGYRGFMLDVSRHFFTLDEVKKFIDLMARYKMNVFHWHLTDDQGWRAEIKQYPKLTTIGATRSSNKETVINKVIQNGNTYWTGVSTSFNKQYGPYYYTQDEMREVVAYAAERHIDVLPEVDMPGHFVAAMASYPEYSCTPGSAPSVWTGWGVSSNVLNVANPDAVQFAKNILGELCDIFPYPYIHIGGDECPTSQWESNAQCQALYSKLGLTSYRPLQTRFIKEMADYVATKGKQLFCWNESVTAGGADLEMMKETGATIMSWNPCQTGVNKALELGLPAIVTEYHGAGGGYYINRRQSNDYGEPEGAGYGDDSVEGCYNYVPVQGSYSAEKLALIKGVQGTFWTEHVGSNEYLEYLALPRLICVAEAGWSQQEQKNWTSFRNRLTKQTSWLDENGYIYARHWMEGYVPLQDTKKEVTPEACSLDNPKWYKIKFTNGGKYLQMNGTAFATTAADKNELNQFFALVPTSTTSPSTNSFKLYSADGYWVSAKSGTATNGQTATLLYGVTDKTKGKTFLLQRHGTDNTAYVISQTSDSSKGFNTWGGSGAGVNIGFYSISDNNDKLIFQEDSDMPATAIHLTCVGNSNISPSHIYNLSGVCLSHAQVGLNIIQENDGSVKKLIVR